MDSQYSEYEYHSLEPGNAESDRRLADMIIRLVEKMDGVERICDLGCGNGYLSGRLAALGYHVTGIDASASGIALASKAYGSGNMEFICAPIGGSLFKKAGNESFDLVISNDVIEHLYRPSELIASAFQMLRTNGYLVIGAPYHGYLKNLVLSLLNRWDVHHGVDWDGGHIKFYSIKTLGALLTRHRFADLRFSFYGRVPWLWKNMICQARKKS